jgi:hypothetical protein
MKKIWDKILNNKKVLSYIIILFFSVIICIPLFSKYMDISKDDGIQHICRLIGTYTTLKEGHMFPVIMSEFCNNFGYSWNLFYSPITAYVPLIFKIFTSSFVMCLKLFIFFTIFLSGVCCFNFVYKISKSYKAGVVSAILYMSTPYHLTDLYNRIAVAELASFVFLPVVFSGMYDLFYKRDKKSYGIIIGAIGLILTHNVITVYTAIFCLIYALIHYKKLVRKTTVKKIFICIILILLCTSFYWIPLLENMLATNYEVFLPYRMYSNDKINESKLNVWELFVAEHIKQNFHIGVAIVIGLILCFIYRKKLLPKCKKNIKIFAIFGIISIIMTLKIFPFEYFPSFLKMIQFVWRMMEFASFFFSCIAGIGFASFMNNHKTKEIFVVIFLVAYVSVSAIQAKTTVETPFNEENYLSAVPVTQYTGRVHAGLASFEYLPQKAFENRQYIEQREDTVIVLTGEADISEEEKENTNLTFKVSNVEENTTLELPYIFYKGYSAKLEKSDGTYINLDVEESENGFCMVSLANIEEGTISVAYTGTTLMKVSYVLTFIGFIFLIIYKKSLTKSRK